MQIEPYDPDHLEAIVRLSLRAWAPVFASIEQSMEREVYAELFPGADWRSIQEQSVRETCATPGTEVTVATVSGSAVGFVAVKLDFALKMGEIHMIAVDPDQQHEGIGTALTEHAVARMKEAGMTVAMVETGGDPGHEPARHTYEKLGFRQLPIARYFRKL